MQWEDFEKNLFDTSIYEINNDSSMSIVLFGSCHMATIGFMINELLDHTYNIYIIISWYFEKEGLENFFMEALNEEIENIVSKCNVFIYHLHMNDFGINATKISEFTDKNSIKLLVPNYRLDFLSDNYTKSLSILNNNICNSSFSEFKFVTENHKNIMFFNTESHPTHYLLFLQSQAIVDKINNKNIHSMNIYSYFDTNNRLRFKQLKEYVSLPGREIITSEVSEKTGIKMDADYFD